MQHFLRPTKAKITIALVVPLYIGVVGQVVDGVTHANVHLSFVPYIFLLVGTLYLMVIDETFFSQIPTFSVGEQILYFCTEVLLPLLINYVLACLVVYLYHTFRRSQ